MDGQMLTAKQEENQTEGKRNEQPTKQQVQLNPSSTLSSPSSSPSHEFSFTISLHPTATKIPENKGNKSPPPIAIDLSPADEIFFHGHLLPLHLLSHLQPISPRSSTNSLDSFTLPIKELSENNDNDDNSNNDISSDDPQENSALGGETRGGKSKSFSLKLPRWRKVHEAREKDDGDDDHLNHQQRQKRKFKFDMSDVVKRYMRMVKPFLVSFRNMKGNSRFRANSKSYSFSGNYNTRSSRKVVFRGSRGDFSAPASMCISPSNSGPLVASGSATPTKSDSTMEELQAAIQAAIAHCKKSIATDEDQIKLP